MGQNELIASFQDTIKLTNEEPLRKLTEQAKKTSKVYKEGFSAGKFQCGKTGEIIVEENTSFAAAKKYRSFGKTAVLNFANPHIPGGGVQNGAMAQEECLCRSSNLYECLTNAKVLEEFYEYHKKIGHYFFSDRLIYTEGVTVFKNDNTIPHLMEENEWFSVDVITCAAPYIAKRKYTNTKALTELFKSRIKSIFEAARDNKVDVLILGAFGCGAFKNPPAIVAKAFHDVICENYYEQQFEKIVFAIKSTVDSMPWEACPNIVAFEMEFYGISQELCKERMSGGTPIAYAYGDAVMPSGRVHKAGNEFLKYFEWKGKNPYFKKQFSILGDSISTLEGYNPQEYKLFYSDEICEKTKVRDMKDTWWGKVIDFFGAELLVNNSWSGSRVTKVPGQEQLFPSGCSSERTSSLHINSVTPDVIIVYLGTNDWALGAKTGKGIQSYKGDIYELFEAAYTRMIFELKENYPSSEIWCCTLCETCISGRSDFSFPHKYGGIHIEEYNSIIKETAFYNKCKLIDLYRYKMPYNTIDGTHPTEEGMSTIATMVIRSMGEEAGSFLDCDGDHDYELYNQTGGRDFYRCKKCGKKYQPASNDIIDFCHSETVVFYKQEKNEQRYDTEMNAAVTLVGTTINEKYKVLREIGKGGPFTSYLVYEKKCNRQWLMKVYDKTSRISCSPAARDAIIQEANMMKRLQHPAIPCVVDMIEDERNIYIVREYIVGTTLESVVNEMGAQPAEQVIEWGKQLCDVLRYLHTLTPPHIHRDIKPANIILMPDGRLKLIDFGIMIVYDSAKKADTCCLGTMGYAAPEQFGIGQSDARTDIYAFGVTLHQLVTGIDPKEPPYEINPICEINPALPRGLEYIISKCIERDPKNRYQTDEELMQDLDRYLSLPLKKESLFSKLFKRRD